MNNSKRIAKNTILMYFRMLTLLIIGFLISRILLQKLGITDFGIYSLVGSIIAMFSSMRTLFVQATQRFLNFEMGKENMERLKIVFNTSIIVNLIVSLLFAISVELLGMWFIYNEINVPADRLYATKVTLHLSVATSIIYIMTTPLDALLIAHERISAYAYLTIIDHILKLLILFLLYLTTDRLIFYAFLLFAVSILMRITYEIYCRKNFSECRYDFIWDKELLTKMTSFAGWQFLGSTAYTLTHNGLNMLLNSFGGTVVNAARGVAYQAFAAVNQLVNNMELVLSPYSVKLFAQDERDKMLSLFAFSSKIMFLITNCVVLPILFFTEEIIELWLGTIPDYSVGFIRLLMLYSIIRSLHTSVDMLFRAVGKMKKYQITESILLAMPLVLSYIALKFGFSLYVVFIFIIIIEVVNLIMILNLAKFDAQLKLKSYYVSVIIPVVISVTISFGLLKYVGDSFGGRLFALITAEVISLVIIYLISFSFKERQAINKLFISKFLKDHD